MTELSSQILVAAPNPETLAWMHNELNRVLPGDTLYQLYGSSLAGRRLRGAIIYGHREHVQRIKPKSKAATEWIGWIESIQMCMIPDAGGIIYI